jgi:hypothetical protein
MIATAERGAVLVETALVSLFLLVFIYSGIQIGVIGLQQLTADGGAFTTAHQGALRGATTTTYEDAPTLAKSTLPALGSEGATVAEPTTGLPPTISVPGQFNLGDTQSRHGAVSMVLPVQVLAKVTSTSAASSVLNLLGDLNISGIAIDPTFMLVNGHGNVDGYAYNSWQAFTTATPPLVDGNNAPPYFVGFNYLRQCPLNQPGNVQTAPGTGEQGCAVSEMTALGLGEYLDTQNWGRAVNGVAAPGAVFGDALLHQQKFAKIAAALAAVNTAQPPAAVLAAKAAILDPTGKGDVACVYSFDNGDLGAYKTGTVTIGQYPLYPAGNNPAAPPGCSAP